MSIQRKVCFAALLSLAALVPGLQAQEAKLISLNSRVIDTSRPIALPEELTAHAGDAAAESQVMLVKFPGPITAAQANELLMVSQ